MLLNLVLTDVAKSYAGRPVLGGVTLTASPGERLALVGENGVGKSTLLRLAAGFEAPDAGSVSRPSSLRLVHQRPPFGLGQSIAEVCGEALAEARRLEAELARLGQAMAEVPAGSSAAGRLASEFDQALRLAELAEVWTAEARLATSLAAFGLADLDRGRKTGQLSGGQRSRLALATTLVVHPTALLLDEPTNHLDAPGMDYLVDQLLAWRGPVLFASHDRWFIDQVATKVLDLDPAMVAHRASQASPGASLSAYSGNYSDFHASKTAARQAWEERFDREQAELKELRGKTTIGWRQVFHSQTPRTEAGSSKKFYADRASNTLARRGRAVQAKLDKLERDQVAKPLKPLRFAGLAAGRARPADQVIIDLQAVAVTSRLAKVSLALRAQDRVLVVGDNAAGKSTLMAVLAGQLDPSQGRRLVVGALRIGLLEQETHWPDPNQTALEAFRSLLPATVQGSTSGTTGLIGPRDLNRPVGQLSVGQQRRLQLAALLAEPPDVLLLDEPTNHISLTLSEELEAALIDHPGAVVVASHDRYLRDHWPGRIIELNPAQPQP